MTATATVPRGTTNGKAAIPPEPTMRTVVPIPLDVIDVGPNVRVNVEGIDELAASIAEHGVLQPIKVRSSGRRWIVVWGQRRVLAARKAGLKSIPALTSIEDLPVDRLSIEQLVENLHRADLAPLDRARAMRSVVDTGMSQADLARKLGIAPSTVANDLRLLETAAEVQAAIADGSLTLAHAKVIAGIDLDLQPKFAERAIKSGWSSHDTERQAKYFADEAKNIRQREATNARHFAEAVEVLGKVANPKQSTLGVVESYGSDVRDRLKAIGWKVVDGYSLDVVTEAVACGCAGVWRLNVPWGESGKVELNPGCNNAEHKAGRQKANDARWEKQRRDEAAKREEQTKAARARGAAIAVFLEAEVAKASISPLIARLVVYSHTKDSFDYDDGLKLIDYWNGDKEALEALDDPAWAILEQVPDDELGELVAKMLGGWIVGYDGASDQVDKILDAAAGLAPETTA